MTFFEVLTALHGRERARALEEEHHRWIREHPSEAALEAVDPLWGPSPEEQRYEAKEREAILASEGYSEDYIKYTVYGIRLCDTKDCSKEIIVTHWFYCYKPHERDKFCWKCQCRLGIDPGSEAIREGRKQREALQRRKDALK